MSEGVIQIRIKALGVVVLVLVGIAVDVLVEPSILHGPINWQHLGVRIGGVLTGLGLGLWWGGWNRA